MRRKTIKILIILIIIIGTIMFLHSACYADNFINPDDFKTTGSNDKTAKDAANKILGIIKSVGAIISVAGIALIGIGYMTSSVESKANYKQTMLPYLIGCVILFAGSQIVQIIYDFVNGLG